MFSSGRTNHQSEVHRLIRRLLDTSVDRAPFWRGEQRGEDRSNRTLPVVLVPYIGSQAILSETTTALTKNLCSQGLALVLSRPFRGDRVAIGFACENALEFVLSEVRENVSLGGGYWQLGIELMQRMPLGDYPELEALAPVAARLQPQ